ncbi:hypothetical protein ABLN67_14405 [Mycobacterium tuberculosis]
MFNRFIYRREWVFAFIVKRFRVFRAPLHRRGPPAGVMRVGLIAEILTATTTFTILTHPIAAVGTCCC